MTFQNITDESPERLHFVYATLTQVNINSAIQRTAICSTSIPPVCIHCQGVFFIAPQEEGSLKSMFRGQFYVFGPIFRDFSASSGWLLSQVGNLDKGHIAPTAPTLSQESTLSTLMSQVRRSGPAGRGIGRYGGPCELRNLGTVSCAPDTAAQHSLTCPAGVLTSLQGLPWHQHWLHNFLHQQGCDQTGHSSVAV